MVLGDGEGNYPEKTRRYLALRVAFSVAYVYFWCIVTSCKIRTGMQAESWLLASCTIGDTGGLQHT